MAGVCSRQRTRGGYTLPLYLPRQVMAELADYISDASPIILFYDDWREYGRPLLSSATESVPVVVFDAMCVLSEYHHRNGNLDAALAWARHAVEAWYFLVNISPTRSPLEVSSALAFRALAPRPHAWTCPMHQLA